MNKVSAIITSGGISSRFGSNKLLEKLGDFTVIETTISKFLDYAFEIIIPCNEEVKNVIQKSKFYSDKIIFSKAGATRQESIYNALMDSSESDIILIHDGARPFINKDIIKKIIDLTYLKHAVVAGKKAIDTIKEIKDDKIIRTIDRNIIFQAHTPQAFDYKLIKEIHIKYRNNPNFTDDSSMVEEAGYDVYFIEDNKENIKITTKEDLPKKVI